MYWFKSNVASSLYAILTSGHLPAPAAEVLEDRIDDIRDSMLELLWGVGEARFARLARCIRFATDVQSLWFLRSDLMGVLASRHGEAAAREKIEAVSAMFKDLLPQGLRSRPSRLDSIARY
jgi:hypothetical protein